MFIVLNQILISFSNILTKYSSKTKDDKMDEEK